MWRWIQYSPWEPSKFTYRTRLKTLAFSKICKIDGFDGFLDIYGAEAGYTPPVAREAQPAE